VSYDWPGNVRELQNVVRRAVLAARGPYLTTREFPDLTVASPRFQPRPYPQTAAYEFPPPEAAPAGPALSAMPALVTLEEHERAAIRQALAATRGNVARAALRLRVPRSTLYRRIKALGV
jgi:DNA-binding NtrC family response regulator